MKQFTYLLVDLGALLIPFLFSFHPRSRFDKTWHALWPAIVLVAIPFLVWDEIFTAASIWGFNPDYVVGIYLFNLPLEELLFFICIPYACIFTYHSMGALGFNGLNKIATRILAWTLVGALLLVGLLHAGRAYTCVTFISLAGLISFIQGWLKPNWLGRFFLMYGIILVPFFTVNGILTGTGLAEPIVWYDDSENLGIRLGTIPIEDAFYGMLLLLAQVGLYEYLLGKKPVNTSQAAN